MTENPYQSPHSTTAAPKTDALAAARGLAVVGGLLQFAPLGIARFTPSHAGTVTIACFFAGAALIASAIVLLVAKGLLEALRE